MQKRVLVGMLILGLLCGLGGCFLEPAENLYAVPRQPESFYNLQSAIEKVMGEGTTYSPPTAGENQQAVQLKDLSGNGEEEAIVFWRSDGELPLLMSVFAKRDGQYREIARADGIGNAFDRVIYADVDRDGCNEIIVGRKVGDNVLQTLNIFALRGDKLEELLSANYSEMVVTDLNADGGNDLFLLRQDTERTNGTAEYYLWQNGAFVRQREAELSAPVGSVKRIITGKMSRQTDALAVFVASAYGETGGIITDVFCFLNGDFTNLTMREDTDTDVQTVRDYYVYSCDIDSDGLIEIPRLIAMPTIPGESEPQEQSLICWYNLLPDGKREDKLLTYHNYAGGWYLVIPWKWQPTLSLQQSTSESNTLARRFVRVENGEAEPVFTITSVTGDYASKRLLDNGWQELRRKGDVTYFCRIEDGVNVSREELQEMFHFIRVDWNTGETD